jgi:hypothetical protein
MAAMIRSTEDMTMIKATTSSILGSRGFCSGFGERMKGGDQPYRQSAGGQQFRSQHDHTRRRTMIKKTYAEEGNSCRVTFELRASANA